MRKRIAYLAFAAALAFCYSCSNDEIVAVNNTPQENEISFRALNNGMTRASDVDANDGTYGLKSLGFKVFANIYGAESEGANYFPETQFTWNGSSYTSANKYYWPSTGTLNFYAWQASWTDQVTHTAGTKAFTVTPAALPENSASAIVQTDLVFANVSNIGKTPGGVSLNFRHAESKVVIKVKNTNANLKITVASVSIGNLYGTGTYIYPGNGTGTSSTPTSTTGAGFLAQTDWDYGEATQIASYSLRMNSNDSYNVLNGVVEAKNITSNSEMILIPQTLTAATTYASATAGAAFNGPYITVALKIQNKSDYDSYLVGDLDNYITAMWPLPTTNWEPGKKYTYTVDLAGGGYYPTNHSDIGTGNALDPILSGEEIKFVNVDVDAWDDTPGETNVGM